MKVEQIPRFQMTGKTIDLQKSPGCASVSVFEQLVCLMGPKTQGAAKTTGPGNKKILPSVVGKYGCMHAECYAMGNK